MSETIKKLKQMYASADLKVPFIMAPSFPVGAFLAPILAHEPVISDRVIQRAERHAKELAFHEPDKALIKRYKKCLSHENDSGRGAWTNQPGGNSVVIQRAWRQYQNELRMAWRTNDDASELNLTAAVSRAGADFVRTRIHKHFKARVKYHNMIQITEHIACWPNLRFIVICEKPTRLLRNNNRQLHSTEKLAVKFADGWGVAAINGVAIPPIYLHQRDKLTLEVIKRTSNVEVKRALIELYGYEQWLADSGAELIDVDTDRVGKPRRLWQIDPTRTLNGWRQVEGLHLLEVVNSTPELDGTYKKYYLQVPGNIHGIKTALEWMLDDQFQWSSHALIET